MKYLRRRQFLRALTMAIAATLVGRGPTPDAAEPPPETPRLRLVTSGVICMAPQFAAEDLLRGEGFTDVQYLKRKGAIQLEDALAAGEADISMSYALRWVIRLDAGDPITVLGGVHTGCVELFGGERVRSITDLKGRKIGVAGFGAIQHQLIGIMLSQVGMDPRKDVEWAIHPFAEAIQLLADGKLDALLALPPEPQELRAKGIGRVLLDTGRDRPWSQYFCCLVGANREFYRKHPVAAKRAVRAILKAADLCTTEPERTARLMVDRGHTPNYDYAVQTVRGLRYRAWREFDPAEAMRFYALRLHEAGYIKSSPQKILAQGCDWRLFNELKKELKA